MPDIIPIIIAAFIAGLIGSGHCVVMCGGILGALSMQINKNAKKTQRMMILLGFNLGRIVCYGLAGAIVGGFGQFLYFWQGSSYLRLIAQALSGLLLMLLGVQLLLQKPDLLKIERLGYGVWKHIQPMLRKWLPVQSPYHAVVVGIFWGFMPCGMVYSMLMMAWLSAFITHGAMIMLAFGFGTLPALFLTGFLASTLTYKRHSRVITTRLAGGLLILLGILSLLSVSLSVDETHHLMQFIKSCIL